MIRTKKGGHLVVISGPSGVGKSTVIAEVMHQRDNLVFSVSYTTRPPRAGEEDGVNYHFVDKAEFERMIRDGELLEYTQYAENYYGTSLADIQAFASQGLDVLLDIEVEGASNVKRKADNAVSHPLPLRSCPAVSAAAEQRTKRWCVLGWNGRRWN